MMFKGKIIQFPHGARVRVEREHKWGGVWYCTILEDNSGDRPPDATVFLRTHELQRGQEVDSVE
jgi:hypothetical protein